MIEKYGIADRIIPSAVLVDCAFHLSRVDCEPDDSLLVSLMCCVRGIVRAANPEGDESAVVADPLRTV